MMRLTKQYVMAFLAVAGLFLWSCNKWDDHNNVNEPVLAETLLDQINQNPDLSKFSEYLKKTHYDQVIASSKTFTVFAPTNAALAAVDASVINDTTQLKLLIGNHIATSSYFTTAPNPSLKVKMLNGKNTIFTKTTFEEASITKADVYVGNGVLHVVNKAIVPKKSIWEYLNTSGVGPQQAAELNSLTYKVRDLAASVITGYDPKTGAPIYKPGVGIVDVNRYLNKDNIRSEDSTYTYFVLTDAAFNAEKAKLGKYYAVSTQDSTDSLGKYAVIKDLAIKGSYSLANLPAQLYSASDSVLYKIDKSAIVSSYTASNGMVYVMSSLNYDLSTKIKPIVIEGESFDKAAGTKGYSIRTGRNSIDPNSPLYNTYFRDLYLANSGTANYWYRYMPVVNAVKYKVYWRAVRDYNLTGTIVLSQMKVAFKAFGNTDLPYKDISVNSTTVNGQTVYTPNYDEVYLGDYTVTRYGQIATFIVGANSTDNSKNFITLDYIKLVPVLP